MTGDTSSSDKECEERPDPSDDPFACSRCGQPLGELKRVRGEDYCDACLSDNDQEESTTDERRYSDIDYTGGDPA